MSETDVIGGSIIYTYDKLSRITREENAEGGIAEYTYDYLGNISAYTVYGGGNERATTEYIYDAAGNLTKEASPLGYTTTYTYDANGNVTSRTDENGTETTYEYDAIGRLIRREDRDGQVQYTYDKVGNVTSATSDAGTVGFTYDALYRTTKVTNEDGTEVTYTYDAAGNRLGITYPDGKAVTTVYDELGQVLSLTDHDGTGILYTRDAEGRVTKETYTDGSTTEYTYNAAGLLTLQKEVTKDNETLRQIVYAYDDAGNLTSENRSGVGIERKDELVRYYYDKADQLVKTNVEGVTKEYVYDKAGNLLSDGESAYTYDIQNRLLTKTNADGTTTYSYDKAGNLTREIAPDGITNYTYSAQNKLVKGEKTNGESSEYIYNALGIRIANTQVRTNKNAGNQNADLRDGSHGTDYLRFLKDGRSDWQRVWETEIGTTVQNDKETVTRHYVVDYLSIANRDIFVTEDGSYTTRYVYDASGRRISAEFDYAPGTKRGEAGENLQSDIAVSIGKVFYRTSILGSTLFAVDKDGNQIAHAIYDPWGKPLTETYTDSNYSGLENLNNYTGYTYDVTLALYFAQNRFYDADTHRFTQEDTVKDGTNWYVYCGNEPVLRVDWNGNSVGILNKHLLLHDNTLGSGGGETGGTSRDRGSVDGIASEAKVETGYMERVTCDVEEQITILNANYESSLPFYGEPGSTKTLYGPDGKIKQQRKYGPDGTPEEDIDYDHGGTGHTFPHRHRWKDGKRGPAEPMPQEEIAPSKSPIEVISEMTGLTGLALILYLIISEGSRIVFPVRNLVPVP